MIAHSNSNSNSNPHSNSNVDWSTPAGVRIAYGLEYTAREEVFRSDWNDQAQLNYRLESVTYTAEFLYSDLKLYRKTVLECRKT